MAYRVTRYSYPQQVQPTNYQGTNYPNNSGFNFNNAILGAGLAPLLGINPLLGIGLSAFLFGNSGQTTNIINIRTGRNYNDFY
jgi:hypothetical protein